MPLMHCDVNGESHFALEFLRKPTENMKILTHLTLAWPSAHLQSGRADSYLIIPKCAEVNVSAFARSTESNSFGMAGADPGLLFATLDGLCFT
jgi:hypothetical protein